MSYAVIHFEATELKRHNYSYDYKESDFNTDIEKFQIEGINYPTLCKILRGETSDQPIRVMGLDFYDKGKLYPASELFMDLIREHALNPEYEVEDLDGDLDDDDSWGETINVR